MLILYFYCFFLSLLDEICFMQKPILVRHLVMIFIVFSYNF